MGIILSEYSVSYFARENFITERRKFIKCQTENGLQAELEGRQINDVCQDDVRGVSQMTLMMK